jgi:HK97 family phage major capsid protein
MAGNQETDKCTTSNLSPASRDILQELTAYHYQRLSQFERDATRRRRAQPLDGPQLDFGTLVVQMGLGGVRDENREALQEYAREIGADFDPARPLVPFAAFRDLVKGTATAGGYLAGNETSEAVDILRPWSVTTRAGLLIEAGLVGDQSIPKVAAKSTPAWLPTEGAQMTPSQPTLGQITVTPKHVGAVVNFSRQLAKQANAHVFVGRELMRTVGTALDQAVLNGSGAAGQPTGILLTAGVQTQSGTTLNAGVLTMKRKLAEANVDDARIAYVSTPAVRELLESRERAAGGGRFVWDRDQVADRPAFVSTDIPAATMLAGDYGNAYVGIWGEAFKLEINPFDPSHFKSGVIQGRIILSCDVAVLHAAGFCKSESIT